MKKLIAVLLSLVLLCNVSALAEMAGGWTIPEETALDEAALDAFYGAVGADSGLLPQCVLGTQVVAGVNYAVLCAAPNSAEIAYVYHSVSGEDQLMREQVLLAFDDLAGGWRPMDDAEPAGETLDAIRGAFDGLLGISVSEYYVLGQQVVAGTNYAVLCRKATVTAEPVEGWALATVYVDLEGKASVTQMEDVVLSLSAEE